LIRVPLLLLRFELQHLDKDYVERATNDVALQLSRADVRLAAILNKALSSSKGAGPSTSTSTTAMPTKPNDNLTTRTSGGIDQFQSEAETKVCCGTGTVVWPNLRSSVYHFVGYPSYGNTKRGAYMCEVDATRLCMRAAKHARRQGRAAPLAAVGTTFLSNAMAARSSDTAIKLGSLSLQERTPKRTS
jgi:hypothetical protein